MDTLRENITNRKVLAKEELRLILDSNIKEQGFNDFDKKLYLKLSLEEDLKEMIKLNKKQEELLIPDTYIKQRSLSRLKDILSEYTHMYSNIRFLIVVNYFYYFTALLKSIDEEIYTKLEPLPNNLGICLIRYGKDSDPFIETNLIEMTYKINKDYENKEYLDYMPIITGLFELLEFKKVDYSYDLKEEELFLKESALNYYSNKNYNALNFKDVHSLTKYVNEDSFLEFILNFSSDEYAESTLKNKLITTHNLIDYTINQNDVIYNQALISLKENKSINLEMIDQLVLRELLITLKD